MFSSIFCFSSADRFFLRKKTIARFLESSFAVNWRLLEREIKLPRIRRERQIMMTENVFLTLCCHRLLSVSLIRYLSFCIIGVNPFRLIFPAEGVRFYNRNAG